MKGTIAFAAILTVSAVSLAAQWPKYSEPGLPRDAQGRINMDAALRIRTLRLLPHSGTSAPMLKGGCR